MKWCLFQPASNGPNIGLSDGVARMIGRMCFWMAPLALAATSLSAGGQAEATVSGESHSIPVGATRTEELPSPTRYSGEQGRITWYVSGPASMLEALEKGFERDRGDLVDVVAMGCGPLRQRVWMEAHSGEIRADVFWGSDPLIYHALDRHHLLDELHIADETSAAIAPVYRSNHNYALVNERYGVIIYNADTVSEERVPCGYAQLASTTDLRMVHADPAQSSTALALVSGIWEIAGNTTDIHAAWVDHGLFLARKSKDVPEKIQEGEFDIGFGAHDAVFRLQKKANASRYPTPLRIMWPEEGAIAIQRPVAVSYNPNRPTENTRLAHELVEYLLSAEAQRITTQFGFVSVRTDVPRPNGIGADIPVHRTDWQMLAQHQMEIDAQFAALFD